MSYKYQRLREQLRQAILSGELSCRLPGERVLAKRYQANAKTVNKALSDLTIDGLLVRHVGRGTFVAGDAKSASIAAGKPRTYGWLMAGNYAGRDGVYQRAAETIRACGHHLERLELPADAEAGLWDDVLKPRQLRQIAGLVLFAARPCETLMASLHRRHLPTIIANNRHETIRTPVVVADYVHGAFDLTQHLIQLGHLEILLLISEALLPAAEDAEKGYRAAMQRYGLSPRSATCVGQVGNWTTLLNGPNRPTALVCVGAELAVRLHQQAGVDIPQSLSIAAIPEPGAPQAAEHHLTTYEVPVDRIVDWTTKLLLAASPGQPPQMVIVPGRLHARQSTGKPATQPTPLATPGETVI
ncbi:MAG TPA: substrate-binding domain-containing protein [Phycisphaerae bacterium]|nr:substrate-binding domain-containing protein [Phycisphaerae bacterium]